MVSPSAPGCDWPHVPLARGPCRSGSSVAASGLQKSAPAYEPCQQPAPATCLVVKPILNHQALPPTPSKGEARRIAKPPATIDNHQKLPSKLVCTRFCRAFRAASRQITPDLACFCVFSISPASLFPFPCCCASHPTATATARTKHFDFPPARRIASHRKANLHRAAALQRPPRPRPTRLLCQRDTVLLCIPASTVLRHPGLSSSALHNPDTPFGLRLDAPLLHPIPPATFLGLSFTRRACVNLLSYLARCLTDMHST